MLNFSDWKIGSKIQSIVFTIVAIAGIGSAIAFSNVKSLGFEIQGIAERDMPWVAALTKIEINNLEQSIGFEQILRLSGYGKDTDGHLKDVEKEFFSYGNKVKEELVAMRDLINKDLQADHISDVEKEELKGALDQVNVIAKKHESYDLTVRLAVDKINNGAAESELTQVIKAVEEEQIKLINEVTDLLEEVDAFTEKALITANNDEVKVERTFLISTLLTLILGFGIGTFIGRGITKPVQGMTQAMKSLSEGNANAEIPAQGRKDEVGEMAISVQVFKENLIKNQEMAAKAAAEQAEQDKRVELRDKITTAFDKDVTTMLESVGQSTFSMEETAQSMSAIAEQSSQQASVVATAAEEASVNVQTVATASEELAASITEISRQVTQSTSITGTAVVEVEDTNKKSRALLEPPTILARLLP
ncbi:MAG: methyl-accepting chemotaxis protein [Magnetovibrio sp.]|nr:methyl-accepting chemotaxis protein [Magnetovibrio sp.]